MSSAACVSVEELIRQIQVFDGKVIKVHGVLCEEFEAFTLLHKSKENINPPLQYLSLDFGGTIQFNPCIIKTYLNQHITVEGVCDCMNSQNHELPHIEIRVSQWEIYKV